MNFHIITIFPHMFDSYLRESIIGRAIKNKNISISFYNPRDHVKDKNKTGYKPVDDKPYGGGPGMVMRAEPILKAVEKAIMVAGRPSSGPRFSEAKAPARPFRKSIGDHKILIINFIPSEEKFTTGHAKKISKKYTDIILICGRYEGIDKRVDKILKTKKFSIGDYVLTGGELPAMVLVDSISRQIKGVLGNYESREEERISSSEVYTRPEVIKWKNKNYKAPKTLLSGNHKEIENWKKSKK